MTTIINTAKKASMLLIVALFVILAASLSTVAHAASIDTVPKALPASATRTFTAADATVMAATPTAFDAASKNDMNPAYVWSDEANTWQNTIKNANLDDDGVLQNACDTNATTTLSIVFDYMDRLTKTLDGYAWDDDGNVYWSRTSEIIPKDIVSEITWVDETINPHKVVNTIYQHDDNADAVQARINAVTSNADIAITALVQPIANNVLVIYTDAATAEELLCVVYDTQD